MAENSKIGWTTHTMNFWWACDKVSAECKHCYIDGIMRRAGKEPFSGPMRTKDWSKPLRWNRKAAITGDPAHASVYDDGAIIYVCVSEDTQAQILTELDGNVKESARSGNGFCGAIIVKPDEWMHCLDVVAGFIEIKWTDCRWADANTIELFVGGQLQRSKK